VTWFVVGNLLYYAIGITLAYVFKDNRPSASTYVPLRCREDHIRFSLIKSVADRANAMIVTPARRCANGYTDQRLHPE